MEREERFVGNGSFGRASSSPERFIEMLRRQEETFFNEERVFSMNVSSDLLRPEGVPGDQTYQGKGTSKIHKTKVYASHSFNVLHMDPKVKEELPRASQRFLDFLDRRKGPLFLEVTREDFSACGDNTPFFKEAEVDIIHYFIRSSQGDDSLEKCLEQGFCRVGEKVTSFKGRSLWQERDVEVWFKTRLETLLTGRIEEVLYAINGEKEEISVYFKVKFPFSEEEHFVQAIQSKLLDDVSPDLCEKWVYVDKENQLHRLQNVAGKRYDTQWEHNWGHVLQRFGNIDRDRALQGFLKEYLEKTVTFPDQGRDSLPEWLLGEKRSAGYYAISSQKEMDGNCISLGYEMETMAVSAAHKMRAALRKKGEQDSYVVDFVMESPVKLTFSNSIFPSGTRGGMYAIEINAAGFSLSPLLKANEEALPKVEVPQKDLAKPLEVRIEGRDMGTVCLEAMVRIAQKPYITYFSLERRVLDPSFGGAFRNFSHLKVLRLRECGLFGDVPKEFLDSLLNLRGLEILDLSGNTLSENAFRDFRTTCLGVRWNLRELFMNLPNRPEVGKERSMKGAVGGALGGGGVGFLVAGPVGAFFGGVLGAFTGGGAAAASDPIITGRKQNKLSERCRDSFSDFMKIPSLQRLVVFNVGRNEEGCGLTGEALKSIREGLKKSVPGMEALEIYLVPRSKGMVYPPEVYQEEPLLDGRVLEEN